MINKIDCLKLQKLYDKGLPNFTIFYSLDLTTFQEESGKKKAIITF